MVGVSYKLDYNDIGANKIADGANQIFYMFVYIQIGQQSHFFLFIYCALYIKLGY